MALVEKRARSPSGDEAPGGEIIVAKKPKSDALTVAGVARTSNLTAPIMQLSGHGGEVLLPPKPEDSQDWAEREVLSFRFAPSGKHCASGSHDKDIFLWEVYGDCVNYGVLKGHKQAVLDIAWSPDSEHIWSCSADKLVMLWDAETGKRIKKMPGHSSFVNTVCTTRQGIALGASGSDDGVIKIWDPRVRGAVSTLPDLYQVTAVQFADDGDRVFTGGLDNEIKIWDLRKEEVALSMVGHTDTVTGLRISPDGNTLLSNGMDNTLRIWDTRPFCEGSRCKMVFSGHMHNFEKQLIRCAWSPTGDRVAAGSADKMVYVWDAKTGQVQYKLPGHKACVNDVDFHPLEPIIGSGSSDKSIFLGEIEAS